ncbi:MAG: uroporphyrinogen-III synthase [Gammaproteobacteria bacterium]
MSSKTCLAGKTIIVTRPLAQAQNILELLEIHQATVVHFPVISISVTNNIETAKQYFRNLANYQIIIFISANAVHYAMSIAQELGVNFKHSTLAAVGHATKAALENYGCKVPIVPQAGFNSEALLNEPRLQKIAKQNILIVRGQGGREHLRETLLSRNAQVDYAEVYQRQIPSERNDIDLSQLSARDSAVLLYSVESAQNLWSLCSPDEQQWLTNVSLIVGSKRISEAAARAGFAKDSIIAENPSDGAMLAALSTWG